MDGRLECGKPKRADISQYFEDNTRFMEIVILLSYYSMCLKAVIGSMIYIQYKLPTKNYFSFIDHNP